MISVFPAGDDAPTTGPLLSSGPPTSRFRWPRARSVGWFAALFAAATLLVVGAVAGGLAAAEYILHDPDPATAQDSAGHPGAAGGPDGASQPRRAWGQQYGQNRATMPNLPDVAAASPAQRDAATDLLTRTEAGTAGYANTDVAQAAGYDFAGSLARAKKNPWMSQWLTRIDAGATPPKPVALRAVNRTYLRDGKVLDPTAPTALIYTYQGHNTWKLVGATFRADRSYPHPPPDPGGPITRWHYGDKDPAVLSLDIYFVAAGDLAHSYALNPG